MYIFISVLEGLTGAVCFSMAVFAIASVGSPKKVKVKKEKTTGGKGLFFKI